MTELTNSEIQLLSSVSDTRLRESLALIRDSVETIWAPGRPKILKDKTDRGIKHSQNIAYYAEKLLSANRGQALSEHECYLLLAGIYLHDIGV